MFTKIDAASGQGLLLVGKVPFVNLQLAYDFAEEMDVALWGNSIPSNGYGFLDPQNISGVAIPDVQEVQAYYSIVALSTL
ncbi:MAG: hypothetical protein LQ346_005674 [Caloplaca aetnensis]|nr:MAG: hypothetical protein LQ346_005674 [Caloplaca aetnensis]